MPSPCASTAPRRFGTARARTALVHLVHSCRKVPDTSVVSAARGACMARTRYLAPSALQKPFYPDALLAKLAGRQGSRSCRWRSGLFQPVPQRWQRDLMSLAKSLQGQMRHRKRRRGSTKRHRPHQVPVALRTEPQCRYRSPRELRRPVRGQEDRNATLEQLNLQIRSLIKLLPRHRLRAGHGTSQSRLGRCPPCQNLNSLSRSSAGKSPPTSPRLNRFRGQKNGPSGITVDDCNPPQPPVAQ